MSNSFKFAENLSEDSLCQGEHAHTHLTESWDIQFPLKCNFCLLKNFRMLPSKQLRHIRIYILMHINSSSSILGRYYIQSFLELEFSECMSACLRSYWSMVSYNNQRLLNYLTKHLCQHLWPMETWLTFFYIVTEFLSFLLSINITHRTVSDFSYLLSALPISSLFPFLYFMVCIYILFSFSGYSGFFVILQ